MAWNPSADAIGATKSIATVMFSVVPTDTATLMTSTGQLRAVPTTTPAGEAVAVADTATTLSGRAMAMLALVDEGVPTATTHVELNSTATTTQCSSSRRRRHSRSIAWHSPQWTPQQLTL